MVDSVHDVDSLRKELEIPEGQVIKTINILFLDISSTCTGYAIANVDFGTKIVKWTRTGALWLDPDWSHQQKYNYMFHVISNYFWVVEGIDYMVVEQYSFNKNKMMGVQVVPEMQGAIKCAAEENGVKVTSILPQTWRKILGIKKNSEGDFKEPTKAKVLEYVQIPEEVISNITGAKRQTPYDVFDAMALAMAWVKRLNFDESKFDFADLKINNHIGHAIGKV